MEINLKQARLIRGYKQKEMAEKLHIQVQTYRKLERNPDLVTIGQAKIISDYLDIPYDNIFFGHDIYLK